MLIIAFAKLCPEISSFFFSTSFWQQHVKTEWKKCRREMALRALRDLEKGPKTKTSPVEP